MSMRRSAAERRSAAKVCPYAERGIPAMQIHPIACGLGHAFLIETESGLCLVDSGSPDEEQRVLACLRALGRSDLKLIWITHAHYDHYGSVTKVNIHLILT